MSVDFSKIYTLLEVCDLAKQWPPLTPIHDLAMNELQKIAKTSQDDLAKIRADEKARIEAEQAEREAASQKKRDEAEALRVEQEEAAAAAKAKQAEDEKAAANLNKVPPTNPDEPIRRPLVAGDTIGPDDNGRRI